MPMEAAISTVTTDILKPPRWQIEWELCDIAALVSGVAREHVRPESLMVEELGLDSISFLEFIMEIEDRYGVSIRQAEEQSAECKQVFTRRPFRVRDIAEIIEIRWPHQKPDRIGHVWRRSRRRNSREKAAKAVPFFQLDGWISEKEWMHGDLYEPLAKLDCGSIQFRRRTDGMRCVLVPSAQVLLGSDADDEQALIDERPSRSVALHSFLIDAEPVSTTAFARFLNSVGRLPKEVLRDWFVLAPEDGRHKHVPLKRGLRGWRPIDGTERQPMMLVSWYGANAYSLWANRRDWRAYRGSNAAVAGSGNSPAAAPPAATMCSLLPSEAQWEYAARGVDPRRYPWGDESPTPSLACVAQHVAGQTYDADAIPAVDVNIPLGISPFGLHHMAGNVWQWCRDWYAPDFYQTAAATRDDPQNATPTGVRSERGGSWVGPAELARSSYRRGRAPEAKGRCLGFRCIGMTQDVPNQIAER